MRAIGKLLQIAHNRRAMKTDLHFSEIGQGEPIVFIHGGFDPAEETFGEQKELATDTALFWSTDVAMGRALRQIALTSMRRWKTSCALSVRVLIW
jgi:hypothetical protein